MSRRPIRQPTLPSADWAVRDEPCVFAQYLREDRVVQQAQGRLHSARERVTLVTPDDSRGETKRSRVGWARAMGASVINLDVAVARLPIVLVVDPVAASRQTMWRLLSRSFGVLEAPDARRAREWLTCRPSIDV